MKTMPLEPQRAVTESQLVGSTAGERPPPKSVDNFDTETESLLLAASQLLSLLLNHRCLMTRYIPVGRCLTPH